MAGGRPRTRIGTYGDIVTRPHAAPAGTRYRASLGMRMWPAGFFLLEEQGVWRRSDVSIGGRL